jgi:hypothetical protein
MRNIKKILTAILLSAILVPTAFAATEVKTTSDSDPLTTVPAESSLPTLCGGGCSDPYSYGDMIYLDVYTTVDVKADKVNIYGTYYVDNTASKTDAIQDMRQAYTDLQTALKGYGTLHRTGIYTYADWEYTNLYDGNLSVKFELSNKSKLDEVTDLFYDADFDNWSEALVTDTSVAEKSVISTLKSLIKAKKENYESILDYTLGSIASLSIYSWADSTTYDQDTGLVTVTVSANLSYRAKSN